MNSLIPFFFGTILALFEIVADDIQVHWRRYATFGCYCIDRDLSE